MSHTRSTRIGANHQISKVNPRNAERLITISFLLDPGRTALSAVRRPSDAPEPGASMSLDHRHARETSRIIAVYGTSLGGPY